jgi:hypothetical protein
MTVVLNITPTLFEASAGKLSSANRYIRKTTGTPDVYFVLDPNMDVKGGGLRYISGDGTVVDDGQYSGTFTSIAAVKVKLN